MSITRCCQLPRPALVGRCCCPADMNGIGAGTSAGINRRGRAASSKSSALSSTGVLVAGENDDEGERLRGVAERHPSRSMAFRYSCSRTACDVGGRVEAPAQQAFNAPQSKRDGRTVCPSSPAARSHGACPRRREIARHNSTTTAVSSSVRSCTSSTTTRSKSANPSRSSSSRSSRIAAARPAPEK